jgi:chromosome segregation ATPase
MSRGANAKRTQQASEEELEREGEQSATPARANGLPIEDFEDLTVPELTRRLAGLSHLELRAIEDYERRHKNRKTLIERIERRILH